MWWALGGVGVVLYIVLLLALGVMCIRKGHWVLFVARLLPAVLLDHRRDHAPRCANRVAQLPSNRDVASGRYGPMHRVVGWQDRDTGSGRTTNADSTSAAERNDDRRSRAAVAPPSRGDGARDARLRSACRSSRGTPASCASHRRESDVDQYRDANRRVREPGAPTRPTAPTPDVHGNHESVVHNVDNPLAGPAGARDAERARAAGRRHVSRRSPWIRPRPHRSAARPGPGAPVGVRAPRRSSPHRGPAGAALSHRSPPVTRR